MDFLTNSRISIPFTNMLRQPQGIFKQRSVIYQLTIQMCQDPAYCVCPQHFRSPTFNPVQPPFSSHFAPIVLTTPPSQPYFRFENTYQQTFSNANSHSRSPLGNATGAEVNGGAEPSPRKRKSGSGSKQTSKKRRTGKATTAPEPEELFGLGPSIPVSNVDGHSNTDAPRYGSLVTERESSQRSTTIASDVWYFTNGLETDEAPHTRPPPDATFHKTRPKSTYLGCRLCV